MRIGIVGTGAVAAKHAAAWQQIGHHVAACANRNETSGRAFAERFGADYAPSVENLCGRADVDLVDVCTLPDFRLDPILLCAKHHKHLLVEKPIATTLETARRMIDAARAAGIVLGVVSQHRFDDASQFLHRAIAAGRLGKLLQCDFHVKWHRSAAYYARPGKGTWQVEGGGALLTQAVHQVDLVRWLAGPIVEVSAVWQIGATHAIESEDIVSAVVRYTNGATGVFQASTAIWPGYPERIEIHGTKGTAIVTGDSLTTWDVENDGGTDDRFASSVTANRADRPPKTMACPTGASDPMAISLTSFERQFQDFVSAIADSRAPLVGGEEGYEALEIADAVYRSCRSGERVTLRG